MAAIFYIILLEMPICNPQSKTAGGEGYFAVRQEKILYISLYL